MRVGSIIVIHVYHRIPQATPLHNAVLVKDNLEIVEYLVGKGAEINNKDDDEVSSYMQVPEHKCARQVQAIVAS